MMMKKIAFLFVIMFAGLYICTAQSNHKGYRLDTIKMAYITKVVNLSPREAQKFWPVYNEYVKTVRLSRRQYAKDELSFDESVVAIKKKYSQKFMGILHSPERVNLVFTAERNYRDILRKELQHRRTGK